MLTTKIIKQTERGLLTAKYPEVELYISPNFVDVFIVAKEKVLVEDDSPDIDVVGEGVPFVKTKQNNK